MTSFARKFKDALISLSRASGMGTVAAASYAMSSPIAIGLSTIAAGALGLYARRANKVVAEQHIYTPVHDETGRLQKWAKDIAAEFGITGRQALVHTLSDDALEKSKKLGLYRVAYEKMLTRYKNAPEYGITHIRGVGNVALVSQPLLGLLNDAEKKAVLYHLFARAASNNNTANETFGFIKFVSSLSNTVTYMGEAIGNTWKQASFFLGTYLGGLGLALGNVVMDRLEHKDAEGNVPLGAEYHSDKQAVGLVQLTGLAGAGVATYFNAQAAPLFLGSKALYIAGDLVNKHFTRSQILAADEKAVEAGAHPLAMMSALQKIEALRQASLTNEWGSAALPEPPKGLRKMWRGLNSETPNHLDRVHRLGVLAQYEGYEETDIVNTMIARADIDGVPLIPAATMSKIMHEMV